MVATFILSFVVGGSLGLRFRIFVVLPVMMLAAIVVLCCGLWGGQSASSILISQIIVLSGSQLGFLAVAFAASLMTEQNEFSTLPRAGRRHQRGV